VNWSPGTWKARHFVGIIVEGGPTAEAVDETMLLRGPLDKSRQSRPVFFSLSATYPSVRNRGLAGKGEARRPCRRGKGRGERGIQRAVEKAADERALIHEQSCGLADW
jgi:hypothetical protein